jgi:hypothetical protein
VNLSTHRLSQYVFSKRIFWRIVALSAYFSWEQSGKKLNNVLEGPRIAGIGDIKPVTVRLTDHYSNTSAICITMRTGQGCNPLKAMRVPIRHVVRGSVDTESLDVASVLVSNEF